jgi:hypothetical protein
VTHSTYRRLPSETWEIILKPAGWAPGDPVHQLAVSLVWTPPDYIVLHEIVFVGRGKIGHGLDQMLVDLGVQISRAIQGRDPQSGEPLK